MWSSYQLCPYLVPRVSLERYVPPLESSEGIMNRSKFTALAIRLELRLKYAYARCSGASLHPQHSGARGWRVRCSRSAIVESLRSVWTKWLFASKDKKSRGTKEMAQWLRMFAAQSWGQLFKPMGRCIAIHNIHLSEWAAWHPLLAFVPAWSCKQIE